MRTDDVSIYYIKQAELAKITYSSPKRRFATTWVRGDSGFFWVNVAIIGPVAEEPEGNLTLGRGKSQHIIETIADVIEMLDKQPGTEDSPGR